MIVWIVLELYAPFVRSSVKIESLLILWVDTVLEIPLDYNMSKNQKSLCTSSFNLLAVLL